MEVGVLGCAGRMGRAVMAEILASPDVRLAGGVELPEHPALGQDLGVLA
jgi:4-hydroxy-tetrahydrodipicolinate reductase